MRVPRISILELMMLVGVVGVDCWAIAEMEGAPTQIGLILAATSMMANVLLFGFWLRMRSPVRSGKAPHFLAGFLVVGTAAMVLEGVLVTIFSGESQQHLIAISMSLSYLLASAGLANGSGTNIWIIYILILTYLAIPQLLLAVIGGCIAIRYRIKLIVERRSQEAAAPAPTIVETIPAQ